MIDDGKYTEYKNLRTEILHTDRICLTILAFLMTATLTCYGIFFEFDIPELILLTSIIWNLGYYYISEKRFIIKRIAYYLKTVIEDESIGLFWENWLAGNKSILDKKFPRWSPYKIETAYAIAIVSINSFILFRLMLNDSNENFMFSPSIYFIVSIIFWIFVVFTSIKSLRKYYRHKEAGQTKNGVS